MAVWLVWLVWLVGCLVVWLFAWLVWLVLLVGWLVGWLVVWLIGCSVGWLVYLVEISKFCIFVTSQVKVGSRKCIMKIVRRKYFQLLF